MSSLLSKLRTLIGASARGPRRFATKDDASRRGTSGAVVPPEVTDISVSQGDTAEAVEEARVKSASSRTGSSRLEALSSKEAGPNAKQTEELEEDRVIDLLKGKQS